MKRFFFRWLLALLVAPGICMAQANPSAMQKAISSLIQQKAIKRGFAANDPRINATLQAAGSALIGTAGAAAVVTLAGVTAPAWVTAAVVMGLGALFTAGVSLAIDGLASWFFNSDGSIGVAKDPPSVPMVQGGAYWSSGERYFAGDWLTAAKPHTECDPVNTDCSKQVWVKKLRNCTFVNADAVRCGIQTIWNGVCDAQCENEYNWGGMLITRKQTGAPANCSAGTFYDSARPTSCVSPTADSVLNVETKSPTDAVSTLTTQDLAKPINPSVLAGVADLAWKKASEQSGYAGVPYDPANPISTADAVEYQQANPASYPTVNDGVAPQPSSSTDPASSPWSLPNSSTSPSPTPTPTPGGETGGETPTDKPMIDWTIVGGSEAIPTQSVSATFTPTLFSAPTGCPAPITFEMMGKAHSISYGPFCDLMATLAPLFLALGAAAAALIFAEAFKP